MRIIHIGNVNCNANGVVQVIKAISEAQIGLGHEVMTLTACHKQDELASFIEVHRTSDFINLIDKFHPDIFVFHSLYIWEYIKFYKILRKRGIPYLLQLHGALSEENYKKSHFKKMFANALFYKKFIRNAQRIIYLNHGEYHKSIVPQINPRFGILPNGVNMPIQQVSRNISTEEPLRILYMGRFDIYHKALDKLIQAISILRTKRLKKNYTFTFYGIGTSSEVDTFKAMIEPVSDVVELKGYAKGLVKDCAFRNSDIFILTSRSEGMPIGVLEALSYGLPCIITQATNMEPIIEKYNCGWITTLTPEDIANSILKAIDDFTKKRELLIANALHAARNFTWPQIAQRSIELYSKSVRNS